MTATAWSPALEIVDLRVPDDHLEPRPRKQRIEPQVVVARVALAVMLVFVGVVVGSRLHVMPGGGVALALPVSPAAGSWVDYSEGVGAVVVSGPASIDVTPGRLMINRIQRAGVLPTNSLSVSVGADELVIVDAAGRVRVVTTDAATPIHFLGKPAEVAAMSSALFVAD